MTEEEGYIVDLNTCDDLSLENIGSLLRGYREISFHFDQSKYKDENKAANALTTTVLKVIKSLPSSVTSLNFSGIDFNLIPSIRLAEIAELLPTQVKKLDLSNTNLREIKSVYLIIFFGNITAPIQDLNLHSNGLGYQKDSLIPLLIGNLTKIESINLASNMLGNCWTEKKFISFLESLNQLESLKSLDLSFNSIVYPEKDPKKFALQIFKSLSNIKNLSFRNNQLSKVFKTNEEEQVLSKILSSLGFSEVDLSQNGLKISKHVAFDKEQGRKTPGPRK